MTETKGNQSIDLALTLLEILSRSHHAMTVTELAVACCVTRTTVYKALTTLVAREYVIRSGNGYLLSGRLFDLGAKFRTQNPLVFPFRQHGLSLIKRHQCPLCITVPGSPGQAILLDNLPGTRIHSHASPLSGSPLPSHATSMGKLVLAFSNKVIREKYLCQGEPLTRYTTSTITDTETLCHELQRIRRAKLAFDHGEYIDRIWSITAPVFDRKATLLAGVCLSGPPSYIEKNAAALTTAICTFAALIAANTNSTL